MTSPRIGNSTPPPTQLMQQGINAQHAPITPSKRMENIDPSKVDPKLLKAAQGMESLFINYLFKVMRDTVPDNEMNLENSATKIYRGMLDTEVAKKVASAGGLGFADLIIASTDTSRYNRRQEKTSPASNGTGGINENKSRDQSRKTSNE